jgi:hypothetical protein
MCIDIDEFMMLMSLEANLKASFHRILRWLDREIVRVYKGVDDVDTV